MRPLSEQQQRLLRHPVGYTVRGRVRVLGPDGTWHDLTDFLGRDFLDGVDVDEGVDSPVGQATVRLMREVRTPEMPSTEALTERENDVLKLLAQGKANKQIARDLVIGEKTVKTHVSNILSKLGVQSRTQAALYAAQNGLAELHTS